MLISLTHIATLIISISININHKKIPFNVDKPEIKIGLSKELKEISGLTWYNGQLGAVQDESGRMYLLNSKTGAIEEKLKFSLPGDFEGVEVVGDTFYAITSSGTLFSFQKNNPSQINRIDTELSWKNDVEGLAYDKRNNQLLIACKGNGSVDDYQTKAKAIYALNLKDKKLSKRPVVTIKKSDLLKHTKSDNFNPSALAIDPLTQDLYILASAGNKLVVLNNEYNIKAVIKLPAKIYAQPEGICFSPAGDLFISNEGDDKKANFYHLLRKPI